MAEESVHKELYERVNVLERAKDVSDERFSHIMGVLTDIKSLLDKTFAEVKTGYVTKEELKAVIQDGKYKMLWGGIVGGVITMVLTSVLGSLPI